MELNIRKLTEDDWGTLIQWWDAWPEWDAPPKDFLPDNGKGGYIVFDGEIPVCAGYIYFTNSKVGWCDWIVSNFNYKDKVKRKEALKFLVSILTEALTQGGCKFSYALLKSKSLVSIYKDLGYVNGDKDYSEMIKKL